MERTGVLLAVVVALCWGGADIVATLAARRQGTFTTTSISLVVSAMMLVLFGLLAFSQLALALSTFVESIGIGLLTGLMAAIGYFSLYRGLEFGPLAIVSPVAAADGAVGAVLAVCILHERLSSWQVIGKWGWYTPIFWTRTFAALTLILCLILWRRLRSQNSGGEASTRERKPPSACVLGISLAAIVGVLETAGLLLVLSGLFLLAIKSA